MKLTEIISETPKQITWGTFYWAPYNFPMYFKHSEHSAVLFFSQHFPWPRARLPVSFQLGCVSFRDLCCVHGWISWNWLVTCLRNCSDLRVGERWKENTNRKRNTRTPHWERHPLAGITSLPTPLKASDCLIYRGPVTGCPGGLRTIPACSAALFIFPATSPVFCKFCSYTADRSILWFVSAGRWEPPLALPIFKQLKLFCIS